MKKRKNKKKKKIFVLFLLLVLALIGAYFLFNLDNKDVIDEIKKTTKKEPTLQIVDLSSTKRPIAVMINNHNQARPYHSGLQDAFVTYEIIVEGGITRLMAVFKDQTTERIGSVRSSRHYFLDYALENDAIYVHYGWSPQAQSDMSALGINNINGLYGDAFWRDLKLPVSYEHKAVTNMEKINNAISSKNYRTDYKSKNVKQELLFNYSSKEVNINENEDSMIANNVVIPYSNYMTSSYVYDATNKYYLRYANGIEHKDYITGLQYHYKNIIIIKVENYNIDSYGRQSLNNVGSGSGYYITNGYARPITWQKDSRSSKTIYKYNDGNEIKVNDGNTFIQIEPINQTPSITE